MRCDSRRRLILGSGLATTMCAVSPVRAALKQIVFTGRTHTTQTTVDVLVIGSGLAGLSAALEARIRSLSVIILEKGPIVGGHSLYSTGSMSVVDTNAGESVEEFVSEAMRVGGGLGNPSLLRQLAEHSVAAKHRLEEMGVKFGERYQASAGLSPRAYGTRAAGRAYVEALAGGLHKQGVSVHLHRRAVALEPWMREERKVGWRVFIKNEKSGETESEVIYARRVILAAGGFTANASVRQRADKRLEFDMPTSANPYGLLWDGATGDAINLAQQAGAAITNGMGVQVVPLWGGRLLDYAGGDIYLDRKGRRFTDETASRGNVTEAVMKLPEKRFWVLTDARSRKGASLGIKLINGIVRKCESLREVAVGMEVDSYVLEETVREYNCAAASGREDAFGRRIFTQTLETPPYYWGEERLCAHVSLDGIVTDEFGRVLDEEGNVVANLYAAGECVGGVFGRDRLGGAAVTNALVMGMICGRA